MLLRTRGIVIRNVRYSDSGIISKIYTRNLGMQSYIVQGIHSPKAAIKASVLQPMTILELVVNHNKIKDLQRIKEAKPSPVLEHLPFEINKSSIGLFMSELIYKTIKEEEANEPLYDFIENCILYLDHSENNEPLLPHYFMLELSRHLGFYPHNNQEDGNDYFHLREGYFSSKALISDECINPSEAVHLSSLLDTNLTVINKTAIPKTSRMILLEKLCSYFEYHLPSFSQVKSLQVLSSILKA